MYYNKMFGTANTIHKSGRYWNGRFINKIEYSSCGRKRKWKWKVFSKWFWLDWVCRKDASAKFCDATGTLVGHISGSVEAGGINKSDFTEIFTLSSNRPNESIGSDNCLVRRQVIIWSNDGILQMHLCVTRSQWVTQLMNIYACKQKQFTRFSTYLIPYTCHVDVKWSWMVSLRLRMY